MASTDTRSGFRLPWSSDRSHDESPDTAAEATTDPTAEEVQPDETSTPPASLNDALGLTRTSEHRPLKANLAPNAPSETEEPAAMIEIDPVAAPAAPAAPRRA